MLGLRTRRITFGGLFNTQSYSVLRYIYYDQIKIGDSCTSP